MSLITLKQNGNVAQMFAKTHYLDEYIFATRDKTNEKIIKALIEGSPHGIVNVRFNKRIQIGAKILQFTLYAQMRFKHASLVNR